ncbi:MAG TPA: hypothetical protein VIN59_05515 [Alphaproteobacteria bacterium]
MRYDNPLRQPASVPYIAGALSGLYAYAATPALHQSEQALLGSFMTGVSMTGLTSIIGGSIAFTVGMGAHILANRLVRHNGTPPSKDELAGYRRISGYGGMIVGTMLTLYYLYGPVQNVVVSGVAAKPAITQSLTPMS